MSHLPLDARAILHHLNELGYRNISAEQLREFLKGKTTLTQTTKRIQKKIPNQRRQFPPLHFVCMCMCVCVLACVFWVRAISISKNYLIFQQFYFYFRSSYTNDSSLCLTVREKQTMTVRGSVKRRKKRNKNEYYSRIVNNSAWGWTETQTHAHTYVCVSCVVCVHAYVLYYVYVCTHVSLCV